MVIEALDGIRARMNGERPVNDLGPSTPTPPDNDDVTVTADDRAIDEDSLRDSQCAAQKAVDLLSTVSGHGAQKLLAAAKLLVQQNADPTHA